MGNSGRYHCAVGPWRKGLPAHWQSPHLRLPLSPAVALRVRGSQMPSVCTWLLLQSPLCPSVLMTQALSILCLSGPSPGQPHAAGVHLPSGPLASTRRSVPLRPSDEPHHSRVLLPRDKPQKETLKNEDNSALYCFHLSSHPSVLAGHYSGLPGSVLLLEKKQL